MELNRLEHLYSKTQKSKYDLYRIPELKINCRILIDRKDKFRKEIKKYDHDFKIWLYSDKINI